MKSGIRIALAIVILGGIALGVMSVSRDAAAQHEPAREDGARHGHGFVPVPPEYGGAKAPPGLWTDARMYR